MMQKTLLLMLIMTLFTTTLSARSRIPVCFPCETITTIKDLSSDDELTEMANEKVNLSYLSNEYGILWIPLWNSNGKYVLSNESNNMYYDINDDVAVLLKNKHSFDVEKTKSPLSLWKKYGGKIIFAIVIGFLIWGNIGSKEDEEVKPTTV